YAGQRYCSVWSGRSRRTGRKVVTTDSSKDFPWNKQERNVYRQNRCGVWEPFLSVFGKCVLDAEEGSCYYRYTNKNITMAWRKKEHEEEICGSRTLSFPCDLPVWLCGLRRRLRRRL